MVFGGGVIPSPIHQSLVKMGETLELQSWKRQSRCSEVAFFAFEKTLDNFFVKELRPFSGVIFNLLARVCRHLEADSRNGWQKRLDGESPAITILSYCKDDGMIPEGRRVLCEPELRYDSSNG